MVKYIIHAELPFLQFEDPYLQPWIDTMQPTFKVKGQQTIRSDCFKKFEDLETELHTELHSLNYRVCRHRRTSVFASTNVGSPVLGKRKLKVEFAQYSTHRRVAQAPKAEIDTYLEEPVEEDNEDFDILAWWKSRSDKFHVLSTMFRDFLAIPLSTVSSEAAFSLGGRILGERKSSLAPEMLEALVCGKDWLFKISEDQDLELEEG